MTAVFSPASSVNSQHATQWSGASPTSVRSGTRARHTSIAFGQRGWNRQPLGGSIRLGGSPESSSTAIADPVRTRSGSGAECDQKLRVRVRGALRHRLGVAALDDPAGVHHQRLVGEVARRGDVVGDVEHGQVQAFLQVPQQVQHAQADRDVEHRHRLVGEQRLGVGGQRAGDRDPLALAAGELVRVLLQVQRRGRQLHAAQQLGQRLLAGVPAVDLQGAGQVVAHGVHRVQRGERVLEDQLDPARVRLELPSALHRGELAADPDLAAGARVQLRQQPGDRRLAGPGLPDQRGDPAPAQTQGDFVDRVHDLGNAGQGRPAAGPHREVLGQRLGFQDHLVVKRRHRWVPSTGRAAAPLNAAARP